jgi:hypothetical protein
MFLSTPATEDKTLYRKGEKEVCDIKLSNYHNIFANYQLIMKMIYSTA